MGKSFTFLLSVLFLINLVFHVRVNIATHDYIPRNIDNFLIQPKNILLASFIGGRSHVKPMLDIAAILVERGHNVTLISSGRYSPQSEYPNINQISLGPPIVYKEVLKSADDLFQKEHSYDNFYAFEDVLVNSYNDTFTKYKNAIIDNNIDLIVCSAIMNDPCMDVVYYLKKPAVGFVGLTTIIFEAAPKPYKSDPVFNECDVSLEKASFSERFRCTVIEPIRALYSVYPFMNRMNDMKKKVDVEPTLVSTSRLNLLLIDTFFGYELPQSLPPNVQEIGPVLSEKYPPLTPELSDFMDKHERVMYVSFGTRFYVAVDNNVKILQSLIVAINKKLVDGVIWALSTTSEDSFPPTLTLTDGTQIQTSTILNNENPHIKIVKFAPQFSVLNHPNTKLFFTHGGTGSIHESLYASTPMLVLPIMGDQMGNAEKLKAAGVALTLNKLKLDVNDILSKLEFLLKDENIKKNSKRLEILAKINSKRKHRAADLIEYILHSNSFNEDEKVNEEFLKEWVPADTRMGIIKGNNYDVLLALLSIVVGFIGGILWIIFKITVKIIIPLLAGQKQKKE